MKSLMRLALTPISLRPTRDLLRTSKTVELAVPLIILTTTSSLKPNHFVVTVASTRPSALSASTISQPIS